MPQLAQAREKALKTNPWLASAPATLSATLLDRCSLRHLSPGEALHFAGDEPLGMYGVVEGALKVYLSAESHGPYFVHMLTTGIWGGEGPAIVNGPRPVTLVAASPTEILSLPRTAMIDLASEHPALWEFYTFHLMDHLSVSFRAISDFMIRDHKLRLISVLLRLANYRSAASPGGIAGQTDPITIHMSQNELAVAANVGRPTANRCLLALRHAGLIDVAYGRVTLLDAAALRLMLAANAE